MFLTGVFKTRAWVADVVFSKWLVKTPSPVYNKEREAGVITYVRRLSSAKVEEETGQEQTKCKRNNTEKDAESFYTISNSLQGQGRKNTHRRAM